MKYYLLGLFVLLAILTTYTAIGGKLSGSTSTEKWLPGGTGNRGNSNFHHK